MPDRRMASDIEGLTTVDVYELASGIGNQFEKMIDSLGPESVTGLMPMVIRALEHLEELATRSEAENTEISELRFAVERLQAEKKLKAEDRAKYERELEQIEESWKNDAKCQHDIITRLQEENHKLNAVIVRNRLHEADQIELIDEQHELQQEVERLKQIVQKQREELRTLEKDLDQRNASTEMLEARVKQLNRQNSECSRKSSQMERHAQNAIFERSDLQTLLHDKDRQIAILEEKIQRSRGGSCGSDDHPLSSSLTQSDNQRYTFEEYQAVLKERDELRAKLKVLEDELATYKPKVDPQITNEEDEDDRDAPVQGPINREPDEKLFPDRYKKESGIQRFFKFFLSPSRPPPPRKPVPSNTMPRKGSCPVINSATATRVSPANKSIPNRQVQDVARSSSNSGNKSE